MRTRRLLVLALAVGLSVAMAVPANARAVKVDVCHLEGNGSYHLINISENALQAHLDHGDAVPGDLVPGMDGYKFSDDSCEIELAVYTLTETLSAQRLWNNGPPFQNEWIAAAIARGAAGTVVMTRAAGSNDVTFDFTFVNLNPGSGYFGGHVVYIDWDGGYPGAFIRLSARMPAELDGTLTWQWVTTLPSGVYNLSFFVGDHTEWSTPMILQTDHDLSFTIP